jgi:hypothetical protein
MVSVIKLRTVIKRIYKIICGVKKVRRVISVGNNTYTDVSAYIIPLQYSASPNIA